MTPQVSKFKVPISFFDRLVCNIAPRYGLSRLKTKASLSYLQESGFVTPGSRRKSVRAWYPSSDTADADSIPKLASLRKGCRDLSMNAPVAQAALTREETNVVGWGLVLQSRIDHEFLGLSKEESFAWARKTEREFRHWSKSPDCDAARTLNFYQMQGHAVYNVSLSGDMFILLPYIKRPNRIYRLAMAAFEADMVDNPATLMNTNKLAGGVEVDANGAPLNYYFRKKLRDNFTLGTTNNDDFQKVSAYGTLSGRQNVIHLYHKLRPGQRRGIPMLAPVIETVKQISRLTEAELTAAVINSFFTVFIKTDPITGGLNDGYVPGDQEVDEDTDARDEHLYELGSGSVIELPKTGQGIELADPKRPNEHFESFYMAIVKQLGGAIQIPAEQLLLYFSSSYSASRAAFLEAWKFYRSRRIWLATKMCQPVYEAWMYEAVTIGRIEAPGFFDDPIIKDAWCKSAWVGPGQGQLDPQKETNAAVTRIKSKLSNYETEHAQIFGTDWEESIDGYVRNTDYLASKELEESLTSASGSSGLESDTETTSE